MKTIKVYLLLLLGVSTFPLQGQDSIGNSPRVIVKPAYLSSMLPGRQRGATRLANDSIVLENSALKAQNDSLLLLLNDEITRSRQVSSELSQAKENIENLKTELEASKDDQLQTSHTSSILLIFNIIAAIILLVTIFWIYMRKKQPEAEEEIHSVAKNHHAVNGNGNGKDAMETRMERIEKLGKLRDKGLLTEEEFQLQKKQILE